MRGPPTKESSAEMGSGHPEDTLGQSAGSFGLEMESRGPEGPQGWAWAGAEGSQARRAGCQRWWPRQQSHGLTEASLSRQPSELEEYSRSSNLRTNKSP